MDRNCFDEQSVFQINNWRFVFLIRYDYGLCEVIVSDNGTQFTSVESSEFSARNGIIHFITSPGHSQSNGQAERYVDTVKSALTKGLRDGKKITNVLLKFLFYYRSIPPATTNSSPAEVFLRRQLRTVLDLLRPNTFDLSQAARHRYQINFDKHTKHLNLQGNDIVLCCDFWDDQNEVKSTPGVLLDRQGS